MVASPVTTQVSNGSLLIAIPIALVAGVVSFASPCIIPVIPGYVGYITGLSGVDLRRNRRGRVLAGSALFISGFTAVYVTALAGVGASAAWLGATQKLLRWSGVLLIVVGVAYLRLFHLPSWSLTVRPPSGLMAAPLLGATSAFGWTACSGPTFGVIVALTLDQASATRGLVLAVAYCLGLGIPLLLVALAFRRALGAVDWVNRHQQVVQRVGAVMLIAVGVLLVTGWWGGWIQHLQGQMTDFVAPL